MPAPGERQLAVTPVVAFSKAMARVMEITPPMAAAKIGWPSRPVAPWDVVVMMRPQPRSCMPGSAARVSQNFWWRNRAMNRW